MSGTIVRIDELSDAIKAEIEAMNQEAIKKCNKAALETATDAVKNLKATSPVRADGKNRKYPPGSYAKSWSKKKDGNTFGVEKYTVYNAKHYSLTHLLEFGHIVAKTGRRSVKKPHIAAANTRAANEFIQKVEGMNL